MKPEIEKFGPCKEAIFFRNQYPDFQTAWNNCHRGDWMLWLAEKLKVDDRKLTLAKGLCAKTVIHLMKDERSKKAIKIAIDYGKGKLTKKELIEAAAAIFDSNVAAYADAVTAIFDSNVAAYASAADAISKNRGKTANICRKILTDDIFKLIQLL